MYADNEILFPHYAIPALRHTRGRKWMNFIDSLSRKKETSVEVIALMAMMIELNGCLACETDSYRAMRGCTACAQQTLRRFKGSDEELIEMYETSLSQLQALQLGYEE